MEEKGSIKGVSFQFLIGRLKTFINRPKLCCRLRFQFLIGRLKTHYGIMEICLLTMFQFLIGRLKTKDILQGITLPDMVSIPHR